MAVMADRIRRNKAIHQLGLTNNWQGAVSMLGSMKSSSMQPDVFSFSALNFCRWDHATLLLRSSPSQVTFNAAGGACGRDNVWPMAAQLFQELGEALLEASAISFGMAMGSVGEHHWRRAFQVLQELTATLEPNQIIMGKAAACCEMHGLWRLALGLLKEMADVQLKINQIITSTVLSVLEKTGSWSQALGLFQPKEADLISFSAAIRTGNTTSKWNLAQTFLQLMQQRSLKPNMVSYGAAITACEKSCHWPVALAILWSNMKSLERNAVSFNAAISACEKAGEWQLALALLDIMLAKKLADKTSFNAAISAAEKARQWQIALALLGDFEPDTISFNASISACEKCSQWTISLDLLSLGSSQVLRPTEVSFSAAISACEKGGNWPFALFLLNRMPEVHLSPNEFSYSAVVTACGAAWWQAVCLLHQMRRDEVEPGGEFLVCLARACEALPLQSLKSLADLEHWTQEFCMAAAGDDFPSSGRKTMANSLQPACQDAKIAMSH
ncbi:unnamed protein product [Cladocopium goreaui]|uniref:Pentatricopeptide repeat-containing protein At1g62930, chloroplastic n=1 Tax=Cladocopium goreaui TaxID=2562237 RepID=A0A9P1CZB7_9DINO|nr:unnamed protein product [Cladocopium goreaui]